LIRTIHIERKISEVASKKPFNWEPRVESVWAAAEDSVLNSDNVLKGIIFQSYSIRSALFYFQSLPCSKMFIIITGICMVDIHY